MELQIWHKVRNPVTIVGSLGVLAALVSWGGTARPGPLFVGGVALLMAMIAVAGALFWWLYLSPLPNAAVRATEHPPELRQIVALLAVLCGGLFSIGTLWDEVWHRLYGSFGNDFLWPPHLMLYGSIGLIALFAGGALLTLLRGTGGLRERFRSEPQIGLLGLVAAYLVASIPSDELWHRIYGLDLTAWSLPHMLLIGGFSLVLLTAVAMQLSLVPATGWRGLRGLRAQEVLALLLVGWAMVILIQIGTTEWDGLRAMNLVDRGAFRAAFWSRPEWLFPVLVVSIICFCGNVAIHTLRRAGAATLVALFVLGFRFIALTVLQPPEMNGQLTYTVHLMAIAPALALDLWYAARLPRADTLGTIAGGNLLVGGVFLLVGLPMIAALMPYPSVNATTLPPMIAFSLLMALAAGGLGARLGGGLGTFNRPTEQVVVKPWLTWVAVGALAVAAVFALSLMLTARPPTV